MGKELKFEKPQPSVQKQSVQKAMEFFGLTFIPFDAGIVGNSGGNVYANFCLLSVRHAVGRRRALFGVEVQTGLVGASVGWHFLFSAVGYNKRAGEKVWSKMKPVQGKWI